MGLASQAGSMVHTRKPTHLCKEVMLHVPDVSDTHINHYRVHTVVICKFQ